MDTFTPARDQLLRHLDEAIEDMHGFRAGIALARTEIAAFMKNNFGVSNPNPTNMVNARLRIMFQHPDARTTRLLEQVAFVQWTERVRELLSDGKTCDELGRIQPEIQDLIAAFRTSNRFRIQQKRAFAELCRISKYLPADVHARTATLLSSPSRSEGIA